MDSVTNDARRDFLRAAGLGGAALALAACGGVERGLTAPAPTTPLVPPSTAVVTPGNPASIQLDFSLETDVLNYAYALEQLEYAFYARVVAEPTYASIFSANEQRILNDLTAHELVHRDFFRAALAGNAIPALNVDFSSINFASRASVLAAARTFEDVGVGAYNGAGRYLKTGALLTLAGKIVSVEARHAAAIRDVLNPRSGDFAPDAFDVGMTPQSVLAAADPFIVENITVINA